MAQRLSLVFLACILLAPTVSAQKVEVSFSGGYSASEGITSTQPPLLGQQFNSIAPESGASFSFTVGAFFNEHMEGEFLFARQSSRLVADGPGGKLPISELNLDNYMGNFVYHWGEHDARVRPYFFGGIGATNYAFGNNLLAGGNGQIPNETRFSTNWGGGVKFYPAPKFGVKVGVRWTPTYIKSDPAGVWCDPFYGCWQVVNNQYSHQFETSGGVTIRF